MPALRSEHRSRRLPVLALLPLLTACGPKQEDFDREFAQGYCALLFECEDPTALEALGWTDEAACVADQSEVDTANTEFDRKAARECLEALDDVTCDDLAANTFPVVCADAE